MGFASRAPSKGDIDQAELMAVELSAGIAIAKNDSEQVIEDLLKKATILESNISFNFGPPSIVIPSYELYGNWLLDQGRYEEAVVQFDKSLKKGPKRRLALKGKLKAAEKLNDTAMINDVRAMLDPGTINS